MPAPSIVAFDLGKVLVDFDHRIAAQRIAARSSKPMPDLAFFLSQSSILVHFDTGQVTGQQVFEELRRVNGFQGTFEEFCAFFADIFTPIHPMVELQAALRRKKIPTYIFSNTNTLAAGHIRRSFPFFGNFDGYIYSYEVGAMKPDAKIYEALEQVTGRHGVEILYVDDRVENIAAGAARGWQVVLQETPEKTIRTFKRLGLLG